MRPTLRRLIVLVSLLMATLAGLAAPATAHPLGNFTVNRYTGIEVSPDQVTLDHVIDLAEVPTAQLGSAIEDLDTVARDQCLRAAAAIDLTVAGRPLSLGVDRSNATTGTGEGGLAVTRIVCALVAPVSITGDDTQLTLQDASAPGQVGWREVTAIGDRMTVTASDVPGTSISERLTRYPTDLLSSPLDVTAAELTLSRGGAAAVPGAAATDAPTSAPSSWLAARVGDLLAGTGLLAGILALLMALVLGASHALAPGHGKTVMAFYLTQGTESAWRPAVAVAVSVTLAHTGSVLLFALLVTVSSEFVPAQLYPWLTLATGLLIIAIGLSLLRRTLRGGGSHHGHSHPGHSHDQHGHHGHGHHAHGHHAHSHSHSGHDHPAHSHDGHSHAHDRAETGTVLTAATSHATTAPVRARSRWEPWTMGLVGGLLPSPSALLLMLAAVALGKAWFGGLLVLFFGIGMAVTLAAAGLLAHDLVGRLERVVARSGRMSSSVRRVVAYGAATGVCLIRLGVVLRTIVSLA